MPNDSAADLAYTQSLANAAQRQANHQQIQEQEEISRLTEAIKSLVLEIRALRESI